MPAKRFIHVDQFTSDNVNFAGAAAMGTAILEETKNVDYVCPFDVCLTGAVLIVANAQMGDTVSLQVVHPQAGVVAQFITDWYVATDKQEQFELQLNYPANLASGLTLRVVYKAASIVGTRTIMVNYFLHKVMEQS